MGKIANVLFIAFSFFAAALNAQSIVSYQYDGAKLVVKFESAIDESSYNDFIIKATASEPFRRVIDVKATFSNKPFEDKKSSKVAARIAQFNSNTARIVLSSQISFDITIKTEDKTMTIAIAGKNANVFGDRAPIVVLDAGHGGKDAGAIGIGKKKEKDVALKVTLLTAQALRARGIDVKMTRQTDKFVSLHDRTGMANKLEADIFVSIHANAVASPSKLEGIETYFLSPATNQRAKEVAALENSVVVDTMEKNAKETFLNFLNREMVVRSNKLAIDIQRSLLVSARGIYSKTRDGGVREGPFWVLTGAQMPAALVEIGYITHKEESKRLENANYQKAIAEGIANGVENYFLNNWKR
ncbi:MAG: N-acetylmuramoyl-L-alanine amidase [Helicobacteraceae bacterium]|jgi:N-acetylmuramoyl-L-alanine amidase|nr:N-acetylmuramoyl-L-alanine amidase [Helicobacteraceae bacterium]